MDKTAKTAKVKAEAGRKVGGDLVALMTQITELEEIRPVNAIVILNKPHSTHTLAGQAFNSIDGIEIDSGFPVIDSNHWRHLSTEDKLKDLKGLIRSVLGMMDALESVHEHLTLFAKKLVDLEEKVKAGR